MGVGLLIPSFCPARVLARPQETRRGRPLLPARSGPEGAEAEDPGALCQQDSRRGHHYRRPVRSKVANPRIAPAADQRAIRDRPMGRPGWSRRDGHRRCPRPPFEPGRPPAIAAAVLTDSVHGTWVYRGSDRIKLNVSQRDITGPLAIRPGTDRGSFDVFFAPYRDLARSTLTLRLIDPDGRISVARFDGGTCDPGRCARDLPRPESRPSLATT